MTFFDITPHQLSNSNLFGHQYFLWWHFFFEPDVSTQILIWEYTITQRLSYWLFIDKTHPFSQLRLFCNTLQIKPTNKNFY